MKLNAVIRWMIDDAQFGISVDSTEDVAIDMDYTEADADSIAAAIEYELNARYGTSFFMSFKPDDGNDFAVENMDELIESLS